MKKNNKILSICIIVSFIILSFIIPSLYNANGIINDVPNKIDDNFGNNNIKSSYNQINMFEGYVDPLNITDYGILYNNSQSISLTSEEDIVLPYYLDGVHYWEASKIENSITNIQDTREWVNNSDFLPRNTYHEDLITPVETPHNYNNNHDFFQTYYETIGKAGVDAIRVHFVNISFDENEDYIGIFGYYSGEVWFLDTGNKSDFFTPWIYEDSVDITYYSDNDAIVGYGCYIDYFEYINDTSSYNNSWDYHQYHNKFSEINSYSTPGYVGSNTAVQVGMNSDPFYDVNERIACTYNQSDLIEIYQNLTIPRGKVIDGYISFDYFPESIINTNNFYIFLAINGKKIYSKGFLDINEAGGSQMWHSTGNINMKLWVNTTNIFNDIIDNQKINISVGIKSSSWTTYSGYLDRFQQVVWFDNVSLVLTTLANSTQEDINLKINNFSLFEDPNNWGHSTLNISDNWDKEHPITLTINTTSPDLSFKLNSKIYGHHNATSKRNQQNVEGLSYTILNNGTILWEFYHNFYMPPFYTEFEFVVDKPLNWKILSILDPTFFSVSFEGGDTGDSYVKVNSSEAIFPGWWKITATSPNYIEIENTEMSKNGEWNLNGFLKDDIAQIRTQINSSDDIPLDLGSTLVNLTIYDIEGNVWYEESQSPNPPDGRVLFSEIDFSTRSTAFGGIYNYTIFWTNGTALGGIKSSLTVIHESYLTLLEPDDSTFNGKVGEFIPVRIWARDSENNNSLTNGIISYNWTTGTMDMSETVSGIYDTILDTEDIGALGLYQIVIQINLIGYTSSNLTLYINLGEDTSLNRLQSDSKIIINSNTTIEFFYADFDDDGIIGATVLVNISNPSYYFVSDLNNGNYEIEINMSYFTSIGTYILKFTFSAPGYEEQSHLYQFSIINVPITTPPGPNILLLAILGISLAIIGALSIVSIRSYVLLPRKRRKESEILSKTQRFKDLRNIQAIVIIDKLSGVPILSKSYSILETHKKELFSGFIQAITTIGEQIADEKTVKGTDEKKAQTTKRDRILELDFKYFYCLICDIEDIRVVLILKEKASNRLRNQARILAEALTLQISQYLQDWDGSVNKFEVIIPPILEGYIEMYYKEVFNLNDPKFIGKIRREGHLNQMEIRVLNVIDSIVKFRNDFYLEYVLNSIHESNKDKVIIALESLIQKQIIIPKKIEGEFTKYF
ncbi:MAG: hypothetical protein JXA99_05305 [Candidatus Lokiarchaeota archaeon]|nr:hypothetical protein [Candidatus Lokiarchaeota archaeon]